MKKALIIIAMVVVNIVTHVGMAGMLATGVYLLNSYFGWAADVPAWRYGLVGIAYLVCNAPFVIRQQKILLDSWMVLF